ncbi:hypothetical protein N692_02085 [Lactiplantibacillus plantarum EGD-AQ4]|nr:hypothetical protein N692_02085 [Lactiplantibacillus plantarum EGD-AQ4]
MSHFNNRCKGIQAVASHILGQFMSIYVPAIVNRPRKSDQDVH